MLSLLLIHYHLHRIRRYFRTNRIAKLITVFLFFLVFAAIAAGVYALFTRGLRSIADDPFLRIAIPLYINELFFLIVGYLMFSGALISGFFALFRGQDAWIVVSPGYSIIPRHVARQVCATALWPLLLIAIPAVIALRALFGLNLIGLVILLIAVVALAAIAVSGALVAIFILGELGVYGRRILHSSIAPRSIIGAGIFVVLAAASLLSWQALTGVRLRQFFQNQDLSSATINIEGLTRPFRFFPSHHAAMTAFYLSKGEMKNAVWPAAALTIVVLLLRALYAASSRRFLRLWQIMQEGHKEARTHVPSLARRRSGWTNALFNALHRFVRGPIGAVAAKEVIIFFRNGKGILWLGFMATLLVIQLALSSFLRHTLIEYGEDAVYKIAFIRSLQIAVIAYFMSAFALRFAFPSFSAELKTAWIFASAPVDFRKIFYAKLIFFAPFFIAVGVGVGILTGSLIPFSVAAWFVFLFLLGIMSLVITLLALSLGALFPNFETDDPQILSTSLPGLGFTLLALSYGAASAYVYMTVFAWNNMRFMIIFSVVSVVIGSALARFAARSLMRIEFARMTS